MLERCHPADGIRHLLQLIQPPKHELLERPQLADSPLQRPELAAISNRQAATLFLTLNPPLPLRPIPPFHALSGYDSI